jgi:hypothetical protein
MLTEKEELEDIVEQYEANMSNATSLHVRILEIVNIRKKYCKQYPRLQMSLSPSSMKS